MLSPVIAPGCARHGRDSFSSVDTLSDYNWLAPRTVTLELVSPASPRGRCRAADRSQDTCGLSVGSGQQLQGVSQIQRVRRAELPRIRNDPLGPQGSRGSLLFGFFG